MQTPAAADQRAVLAGDSGGGSGGGSGGAPRALGGERDLRWLVRVWVLAALALAPRLREGCVLVVAGMSVGILGVGSSSLVPSLRPFSVAPQDSAGPPRTSLRSTQALSLAPRAPLLAEPQAPGATAQVSGFASLPVACTAAAVLLASCDGLRRTRGALALFLAATAVATASWGWHSAVDDAAGLFLAVAAVVLGQLVVHPRRRPTLRCR